MEEAFEIINTRIIDNVKNGTPLCFEEGEFGESWKKIKDVKDYYRKKGYVFSSLVNWFSMRYDPAAAADPNLYYQGEIKPIFKKEKDNG